MAWIIISILSDDNIVENNKQYETDRIQQGDKEIRKEKTILKNYVCVLYLQLCL